VTGGGDNLILGHQNVTTGSGNVTLNANTVYLMPVTPTGAVQLNDVTFTTIQNSLTLQYAAVLYADNNNAPGELMSVGEVMTGVTFGVDSQSPFTNPLGLLADTKYWIGIITSEALALPITESADAGAVQFSQPFTNGPPVTAPSGTATKNLQMWGDFITASVIEARSYVYTWVTEYDEEGPPSPATLVNGWSNGTWTIGLFTPPANEMGVTRNIKKLNIYRTVSGTTGNTVFYFVATVDVGVLTYTDIIDDVEVVQNIQLPSTTWFPPPEGLQAIYSMPNGMLVGFKGNEIWFCEPYRPHAWPPGYVLTTEFPIVGLGISGQSCVACTSGKPYIASGVSPGTTTLTKIELPEPCLDHACILGTGSGVFYMSPNGLIEIDPSTLSGINTTEMWITREKWRVLAPQTTPRAILLASSYFCFNQDFGFTIELNNDNQSFSIWPQPGGHRIGFSQMTKPNDFPVENVMVDPWTGVGLLLQNNGVYYYDFGDQAPTIQTYTYRSKIFQQTNKKNFAAMKVYFTVPPGTAPLNATVKEDDTDDPSWNTLDADRYGYIKVYADGVLRTVREIRNSGGLLRILDGFKAEEWEIEVISRVTISNIQIAPTVKELASV
jgi:hypothetical protein